MLINLLPMCYHPSHDPFATIGPPSCQTVDSEKPASKLIRAVLRIVEIDPQTWTQYSIHRCYCKSKGKGKEEIEDELDPSKTLDQLGIKEGHSIFIRKREDRVDDMEEDQDDISLSPSRKRRERDEDEVATHSSLLAPAPTPKSYLEHLEPQAAIAARAISKLLGGDAWKVQSIRKLGLIKTKSAPCLLALHKAIKTSLQIPQVATAEAGLFNTDLVEALIRAYHQRTGSCSGKKKDSYFWNLSPSDYERANELLKGRIEQDGSWERSSISHLDESAVFSSPASRFPLSDSELSGQSLNAAREICACWNNEKWINQSPMPGLSPINLKNIKINAVLRQIAQLTRVKPGEATPDGLPPIVLKALIDSIKKNNEDFSPNIRSCKGGWAQKRTLKDALALLKKRIAITRSTPSSVAGPSTEASGSRTGEERRPQVIAYRFDLSFPQTVTPSSQASSSNAAPSSASATPTAVSSHSSSSLLSATVAASNGVGANVSLGPVSLCVNVLGSAVPCGSGSSSTSASASSSSATSSTVPSSSAAASSSQPSSSMAASPSNVVSSVVAAPSSIAASVGSSVVSNVISAVVSPSASASISAGGSVPTSIPASVQAPALSATLAASSGVGAGASLDLGGVATVNICVNALGAPVACSASGAISTTSTVVTASSGLSLPTGITSVLPPTSSNGSGGLFSSVVSMVSSVVLGPSSSIPIASIPTGAPTQVSSLTSQLNSLASSVLSVPSISLGNGNLPSQAASSLASDLGSLASSLPTASAPAQDQPSLRS